MGVNQVGLNPWNNMDNLILNGSNHVYECQDSLFKLRDWLLVRDFAIKFQQFILLHRCTVHL